MSGLTLWAIKRIPERIGCGRESVAESGYGKVVNNQESTPQHLTAPSKVLCAL